MRFLALLLCVASLSAPLVSAGDSVLKNSPPVINAAVALAIDSHGNKYLGGFLKDSIDLNPVKGSDIRKSRGTSNNNQYFIRLDADGNYKWGQQFGGTGDDNPTGNGGSLMRFAVSNNVLYVATTFSSTDAFVGPTPNTSGKGATRSIATQGSFDVAIIALNADTGEPVTTFGVGGVVTFGGTGTEGARGITVDAGTVYVSGVLGSSDAGFNGAGTIARAGTGNDVFVLALDAVTGTPRISFGNSGARVFGQSGSSEQAGEIVVSGSTVYTVGTLSSANSDFDGFVLALDSATGINVSSFGTGGVQTLGGSDTDGATGVAVNGNILYVSGGFRSTDFGIGTHGSISTSGISDGFIVALNANNGTPYTTFGNNGFVQCGGSGGSETVEKILISDNVLYGSGYGSTPTFRINNASNDFQLFGFFDTYLFAINSFTGAPLASFGNGDGLISVGYGDKQDSRTPVQDTFSFSRDMAVGVNKVAQVGTTNGKTIRIDNGDPIDDPTHAFMVEAATVFDVKPPIFADPNPTRPGLTVTLTVTGPIAAAGVVTWNFGDSTPTQQGTTVTHVFNGTVDTTFTTTATSAGGQLTLPIILYTPNVPNQANVGNGVKVTEPINLLSLTLDKSEGGILEFLSDTTLLRGTTEDTITKVTEGNDANVFVSRRAIFKARSPGIAVATTVAKVGDDQRGRVRKMVAVSAREIGGSNPLPMAPDKTITVSSLTGKFLFTSEKADAVAFKGTVLLPAGLDLSNPNGIEVYVGIGNVVDHVVVSSKGKVSGSDFKVVKKAAVKFPKLKGTTTTAGGEKAALQVQFSLANLDKEGFDTEGITTEVTSTEEGAKSVIRSIQIALVIGGVSYEAPVMVDYKLSKNSDAGQFKNRRAN